MLSLDHVLTSFSSRVARPYDEYTYTYFHLRLLYGVQASCSHCEVQLLVYAISGSYLSTDYRAAAKKDTRMDGCLPALFQAARPD